MARPTEVTAASALPRPADECEAAWKPTMLESTMKHPLMSMTLGVSLLITSTGLALAGNVHDVTGTKGQPNQTIGSDQTGSATPGHASAAPGSAFNPNGVADAKYAGTQDQNSKNPKSVSQYDVAGFQQSHNH